MKHSFSLQDLFDFVDLAGKSTYASGKPPLAQSERRNFTEYSFEKDQWSYRDSYIGHTKSAGQEVVRYNDEVVWANAYCGGMTLGNESLSSRTYHFLKEALSVDDDSFASLRGPSEYRKGDWQYTYAQQGDIGNFSGYEEIRFQGNVVFFHRAIGGTVVNT